MPDTEKSESILSTPNYDYPSLKQQDISIMEKKIV